MKKEELKIKCPVGGEIIDWRNIRKGKTPGTLACFCINHGISFIAEGDYEESKYKMPYDDSPMIKEKKIEKKEKKLMPVKKRTYYIRCTREGGCPNGYDKKAQKGHENPNDKLCFECMEELKKINKQKSPWE